MPLPFDHLISAEQLTKEALGSIFAVADEMEQVWSGGSRSTVLQEKIIALLFYEPSSRTMLSFQAAVQGLSAGMIMAQGRAMSSLEKGESIEDTIRMVARYADLIVMRHPEAGSAQRATEVSHVPFINAGDGGNEHPTQSALDLYTIQKVRGTLEGLHVAFACDPLHSRTIRSLALLLSQFSGTQFTFISPPSLRISDELKQRLDERNIRYEESDDLHAGVDADVLYMNRLQEERFTDPKEFEANRKKYVLRADMLKGKDVTVMDPLPRVDEIEPAVDELPNAVYFDQARNGVPVRMALLSMMLGKQ